MCALPFGSLTFRAARRRRRSSLQSFGVCKASHTTWTTWRERTRSYVAECRSRRHSRTVKMTTWGWEQTERGWILLTTNNDGMTSLCAKCLMSCPPFQVQCQTLAGQLQDAQAKLAAAREESKITKRRAELLERELLQVQEELKNVFLSHKQAQNKSSKQEVNLTKSSLRFTKWPKVCGQVVFFWWHDSATAHNQLCEETKLKFGTDSCLCWCFTNKPRGVNMKLDRQTGESWIGQFVLAIVFLRVTDRSFRFNWQFSHRPKQIALIRQTHQGPF